ncbi:MAG: universal stress protein [Anaerolineae bacterium]|jgi:nucleotide-binding universal stress UspA family protein
MRLKQPRHIICAVRGGPESRETVTRAIDLALESGAWLTFYRVLDAEFLNHATIGPLSVVYRELREMGQFAMLILCDRAQRRGVQKVDSIVREGNVRKQLREFAIETHADVMVMGRPTRSPGSNTFKAAEFDEFVAEMAEEASLEIVVVEPLLVSEAK